MLSKQGHDLGEDGLAHQLALVVFGHDAWTHLQLLAHLPTEGPSRGSGYIARLAIRLEGLLKLTV